MLQGTAMIYTNSQDPSETTNDTPNHTPDDELTPYLRPDRPELMDVPYVRDDDGQTASSGALVAKATIVNPATRGVMPTRRPTAAAPLTRLSPPR